MTINARFNRHLPARCICSDCQNVASLQVTNTIIKPAELLLKTEKLITSLHLSELQAPLLKFHSLTCEIAKNVLAGYILDTAIQYCTNAKEMSFQNDSLHVFKFDFDPTDFHLQFDTNKLHFGRSEIIAFAVLHRHTNCTRNFVRT